MLIRLRHIFRNSAGFLYHLPIFLYKELFNNYLAQNLAKTITSFLTILLVKAFPQSSNILTIISHERAW